MFPSFFRHNIKNQDDTSRHNIKYQRRYCMVLRKQYGIATTLVGARYDVSAKCLPNETMRNNNSLYDIHLPITYDIIRGMLHQEIFVEPRAEKCDKLGTERISPLAFQQSGVLNFNTRIYFQCEHCNAGG